MRTFIDITTDKLRSVVSLEADPHAAVVGYIKVFFRHSDRIEIGTVRVVEK